MNLLTAKDVASRTGYSYNTVRNALRWGRYGFPKPIQAGNKCKLLWDESDIDSWIATQKSRNNTQTAHG